MANTLLELLESLVPIPRLGKQWQSGIFGFSLFRVIPDFHPTLHSIIETKLKLYPRCRNLRATGDLETPLQGV